MTIHNENTRKAHLGWRTGLLLVWCLGWGLLASLGAAAAEYAGTAAYLDIGMGARSLGMGGAFVAVADDPATLVYNPAGLANLTGWQLTTLYSTEYGLSNYGAVGLAGSSLGVAVLSLNSSGIDATDEFGNPTGKFDVGSTAALAGYSVKLGTLALGANVVYATESLAQKQGQGITGSAGLLLRANALQLGLVMRHCFGEMKYDNTAYPFTSAMVAGAAIKTSTWLLTGEYEVNATAGNQLRAGAQWHIVPALALRAGAAYGQETRQMDISAGLGVQLGSLQVDYAYMQPSQLPAAHRLSLGIRF